MFNSRPTPSSKTYVADFGSSQEKDSLVRRLPVREGSALHRKVTYTCRNGPEISMKMCILNVLVNVLVMPGNQI